ncbi:suppressor of cytokine signaling 5-like isoform X1 [Haliotis cracherodii]|uniref:suppressor of cytokine signaling 5-like isoform X1 n=2 Tax=Haliotis cracherodii TaxID=6455 RepID=UPI0039EBF7F2
MESDTSDPDAIQHLDSVIMEENQCRGIVNIDEAVAPVRHRLHRSTVRPFFCCGSEVSLVSLVDSLDLGPSTASSSLTSETTLEAPMSAGIKTDGSSSGCRRTSLRGKRSEKLQQNKSKKKFWSLRGKLGSRFVGPHARNDVCQHQMSCLCSSHRKRGTMPCLGHEDLTSQGTLRTSGHLGAMLSGLRVGQNAAVPLIDIARVNFDALYPTQDMDEIRREERAKEIEHGIEISPQHWPVNLFSVVTRSGPSQHRGRMNVSTRHHSLSSVSFPPFASLTPSSSDYEESVYGDSSVLCLQALANHLPAVLQPPASVSQQPVHPAAHSQVEYIHCLVPDLVNISCCSFYWGVMDRYEAEALLENKPEGTFLLRDSAQEDFLFSVSFRRYNRSLHARIEQWNHLFSFDAHDPAVFACDSVVGLIEHYKDPECCMFFEPMLTLPLNRTSCFPLKHLCRSQICNNISYDDVNVLPLPSSLKEYLKYYHYKQKVRVKRLDIP